MRARHRHFNPRFAGADLVLDARYIDQSDNTAVSIWADRSGNAHDATQAASASQPTFETAEQGGNGGVNFDGSNDELRGTSFSPTAVPRSVHITFRADVSDENTLFQVPIRPQNNSITGAGWIARWGGVRSISGDTLATNQTMGNAPASYTAATIGSWSSDSSRNVSFAFDGVSQTVSGNPPRDIPAPATTGYILGRLQNYQGTDFAQLWDGLIFSVHVWADEQIAAPLRKRCEHASAFSFKIACS